MPIGLRTGLIAFAIPLILVATNVQVRGQSTVEGPDSWPRPGCPPRCKDLGIENAEPSAGELDRARKDAKPSGSPFREQSPFAGANSAGNNTSGR